MPPIYRHDCTTCELIENIIVEGTKYDVYRCEQKGFRPGSSWLARYDDGGGNYWALPWSVLKTVDPDKTSALIREVFLIAREIEERRENK